MSTGLPREDASLTGPRPRRAVSRSSPGGGANMSQGGLASPRRLLGFRLTGRTTTSEPPRLNPRYARLKSPPFSTRAALSMENRRSRLCRTGARSGLSRFEGGLVLFGWRILDLLFRRRWVRRNDHMACVPVSVPIDPNERSKSSPDSEGRPSIGLDRFGLYPARRLS